MSVVDEIKKSTVSPYEKDFNLLKSDPKYKAKVEKLQK